jgi:hypothetical protein
MKHVVRLAAFALLPILAGCHSSDGGRASSPMALKIYDVPPAQANELSGALGIAINKDGNVMPAGPGKLMVYAPADTQASIASALAQLRDTASAKASPTQVTLHFWTIDATPGDAPDDPALKELAPSLASLRQTLGPLSFQLEQTISAAAAANRSGSLTTLSHDTPHIFEFTLGAVQNDALSLNLRYHDGYAASTSSGLSASSGLVELKTNIDTHLGQYTVLAQAPNDNCTVIRGTSASDPRPTETKSCQNGWRLLVVRADRADSSH